METENLKKRIEETQKVLIELEYLKMDIKSLISKDEPYFETVVKDSNFFYRLSLNSFKLFVIEVCKIFQSSQESSLIHTINFCCSNINKIDWCHEITIIELESYRNELKLLEIEHLDGMKILRNKYFAHLDKNREKFELTTKLTDCWEVQETCKRVFSELNRTLNDTTFIFNLIPKKPIELIKLHRSKVIWNYVQEERKMDPNNPLLDKIRDLMVGS